ncbi:NAD(P)H-binding protein [Paenibacillus rhizovicinus]|nr:NAD(P)H-binding protein [Paenibacillus rhizovicinus]
MNKVLILGANGSIARHAIERFLNDTDVELTLYLRNAGRLEKMDGSRVRVVEGDVLDKETLKHAMEGQDVVYANLDGDLERMARTIVETMNETGVMRLIFISSMGIYGEVPGQMYSPILDPYRKSAEIIEASDLTYTIIRPGWFTNKNEVEYNTHKGEPSKGGKFPAKALPTSS